MPTFYFKAEKINNESKITLGASAKLPHSAPISNDGIGSLFCLNQFQYAAAVTGVSIETAIILGFCVVHLITLIKK